MTPRIGLRWTVAVAVGLLVGCAPPGALPVEVPDADFRDLEDAGSIAIGNDAATPMVCAPCAVGQTCDQATGVCVWTGGCADGGTAPSCESQGVQCGEMDYLDPCDGLTKQWPCGDCPAPQECAAGRCICTGEADQALCVAHFAKCGAVTAADRCGVLRTVDCGACALGEVCVPGTKTCRALTPCSEGCLAPTAACHQGFCVECVGSGECGAGTVCDPALNLCLQCLQDADCPSARPRCVVGTGVCVACLRGADCPSGECDATLHTCATPRPANDACDGAQRVAVGGGSVAGDTTRALPDAEGSCGGKGPDVAFALAVPSTGFYEISAVGLDAFQPVLHVRSQCGEPGTELGCATAVDGRATVRTRLRAGEAVAWVGGNGAPGRFELKLEQVIPQPSAPVGDTCASPVLLFPTPASGDRLVAQATASTLAAADDFASSVAYSDGPDVVFRVVLTNPQRVTAEVTRKSVVAYQPAVYLRRACDDFATEEASSLPITGGRATAVASNLPPGEHYLIVDGSDQSAGDFDLVLTLDRPDPMEDRCPGYPLAVPAAGATTSASADTAGATDQAEGSCGGSGPDAVYAFTLAAPTKLSVRVAAEDGALQPVFYLRRAACDGPTAEEYRCVAAPAASPDGAAAEATYDPLPAGAWWLFVDGFGGTRGRYTVELSR